MILRERAQAELMIIGSNSFESLPPFIPKTLPLIMQC